MQIAEGHNFYTVSAGLTSKQRPKGYETAKHPEIMDFRSYGWWVKPIHLLPSESEVGEEEYDRIEEDIIDRMGHFLDDQWRAHVPTWSERCDDPLFIIDWLENHQPSGGASKDLTYAVLYHLAGDNILASEYLRRPIQKAEISYEELYTKIHRERRGSWLRRLLYPNCWSEERVAKAAALRLKLSQEFAEGARKLANGLGIAL